MKRWIKSVAVVLVLALVGLGIGRTVMQRQADKAALTAQLANKTQVAVELAATDVVAVQEVVLEQGLPISGSLRATDSAWLKARVAGELRDLAVREGDRVAAGEVIATIDPTEYQTRLEQARRQADAARAQVDIAQRNFTNNRALVEKGFISKTALDTSLANLNAARATYQAALAATELARKAIADTAVRSPISGIVSQRLVQNGERVNVDARIAEVLDLSTMELEAALGAADSLAVQVGQRAQITVEGSSRVLDATVARINPTAQAGSRSVLVYLRIDDPQGLRAGLFAQGRLSTRELKTLAVPLSAIRTDKPSPYVQTVQDDKVVHRDVTPGERGKVGDQVLVQVQELAAGTRVLVGSVGSIREGTAVRFTGGMLPGAPSPAGPPPTPTGPAKAAGIALDATSAR